MKTSRIAIGTKLICTCVLEYGRVQKGATGTYTYGSGWDVGMFVVTLDSGAKIRAQSYEEMMNIWKVA